MKINRLLYISLGLNVTLAGAWFHQFSGRATPAGVVTSGPPEVSTATAAAPVAPVDHTGIARVVPPPQAPAVDWQKLEADDYPTYIANLRAAGIPEQTVRSIVTGEIAGEFEERRRVLEARPAETDLQRLERRQEGERLQEEQRAAVAGLFHERTNGGVAEGRAGEAAAESPAREGRIGPSGAVRVAALPAVLVPPSPEIQFTEQQAAEWTRLQQDFIQAVGGTSQNATDPAYRERWLSAREQSDDLFRAKFGTEAYVLQSIEASRRGNR
jgi:hypothetical protein